MTAPRIIVRASAVLASCLLVASAARAQAPVSDVVISVHPTVATVLVVSWNQDVAVAGGWLEYSINGRPWQASPERELAQGPQQELVLGVPADTLVDVRIMNRLLPKDPPLSSAETWTPMTGSLPDNLEEPTFVAYNPALASPSRFLLVSFNLFGEGSALILNRQGRIVWYRTPEGGHYMLVPRVARSGNHLVLDTDTYWSSGQNETSTINRVTINNEVLETIEVPDLHHGWAEHGDGTIVWGKNPSGFDHEELWAIDPAGNSWMIWDSDTWDIPGQVAGNGISFEKSDATVLLSFWTNDSAVEIDFESGEIIRQFGDVAGSWSFDPEDSQFWFPHGVNYTDAHTLIVSTHLLSGYGQPGDEQRIREYALDDDSETLVEIWSYGEGADIYSPTWGAALRLDNGNTLLNTGSDPLIREVTSDGETVWELDWNGGGGFTQMLVGDMTPIEGIEDLYALDGGSKETQAAPSVSDPPSDSIDARQPSDLECTQFFGWDSIDIIYDGDTAEVQASDFTVTVDPADVTPPGIVTVVPSGNTATLEFDTRIPLRHWTIITHDASGFATRIGALPADVSGDRTSGPVDILDLIDFLNEVGPALEIWQTDIDRSGEANAADILTEIDLLNGAGCFDEWSSATLPE